MNRNSYSESGNVRKGKTGGGSKKSRVCACCKRKLPLSNFYQSGVGRTPDSYCKECRRQASRRYRDERSMERVGRLFHSKLTIMDEENQEVRMAMILAAKRMVSESVQRKQQREAAEEDARVDRELDNLPVCPVDDEPCPSSPPESPEEKEPPSAEEDGGSSDEQADPSGKEEPWHE